MTIISRSCRFRATRVACLLLAAAAFSSVARAQLVPGTGSHSTRSSDTFEDPKWVYRLNLPKSSYENDDQQRLPAGQSANNRWFEGMKRGQPDTIQRVATPEGGIPGSTGALLLRSMQTGVPGRFSGQNQQDDLIVNVSGLEGPISPAASPSVVVRVYVPPFDEWEQRTGPAFGFRIACQAYTTKRVGRRGSATKLEPYWPGMFIHFVKGDGAKTPDSARMILRGGPQGHDFAGPQISKPGWWTLGMSVTPDGQIHYYAHEGIDDLRPSDHLSSQFPYGFRAERFDAYFFNIISGDNGNWSTSWVIDDPALYSMRR